MLGTRGSDLARAQTAMVEQALRAAHPELHLEVQIIRTSGDERAGVSPMGPVDRRAGRKGMFTAEIERVLLDGGIDVAVHSAKDLPSDPNAGAAIAAVLARGAVGDVLVKKREPLRRIGTASVRRQHQLRAKWPQVEVVDLRGNVPTRLRKLEEQEELDAIVLARAGLERLGIIPPHEVVELSTDEFVPAGGQGIIALQIRRGDATAAELLSRIDDEATHLCLRAEREFLRLLQGDCDSPVGVHANGNWIWSQVFPADAAMKSARLPWKEETPEEIAAMLFGSIDESNKS
ncbi:hydroxymethylbilane synthase [soil metagenome]